MTIWGKKCFSSFSCKEQGIHPTAQLRCTAKQHCRSHIQSLNFVLKDLSHSRDSNLNPCIEAHVI
eukprot:146908-Ditylum_brightwellii.AAC.1